MVLSFFCDDNAGRKLLPCSDHQIMACTLGRRSPALVVDLRRRNVPMTEQIFHFDDVNADIEK